ncbi:PaaI family thioesterase [Parvibaculum sp.]|uniref:PaaI family thioesterase n=1 Tax=Parvibaculum sp. TaxID=2024848 RepID=UPI00320EE6B0
MKTPPPRLAGYESWDGTDPFEDRAGPFFFRRLETGEVRCAFEATPAHCNGGGFLHGGLLMTFADFSLFAIGRDVIGGHAVTVSFNAEFTAAGLPGDIVEARGEVMKNTGSMVFLRGRVYTASAEGERVLLNFSGIVKRVRQKPESH